MNKMNSYVYDLDNTLIFTDYLNNESYNYALKSMGFAPIHNCKRITRDIVFSKCSDLSCFQKSSIVELKQQYFVSNLEKTMPNKNLIKILGTQNTENCILWTSADEARVLAILKHHEIHYEFKKILFSRKKNVELDIRKICKIFDCSLENLIFYEDNPNVIKTLKELKVNVKAISSCELDYSSNNLD